MKQIEIPFLVGDEVIIKNNIDGKNVFAIDVVVQVIITDDDFQFVCVNAGRPIYYKSKNIIENSKINRIKLKYLGFEEIEPYAIN